MKTLNIKVLILLLLFIFPMINSAYALVDDKANHIILWRDYCIIIRSPKKQLASTLGHNPLGIILKDNITRLTISGDYMAISVPATKLNETLNKYKRNHLIVIE